MKIIITETQYRCLLTEEKVNKLLMNIKEESRYKDFDKMLEIVFFKYALSPNMIKSHSDIKEWVDYMINWWIGAAYITKGWDKIGKDISDIPQMGKDYVIEKIDEFYSDKITSTYKIKDPFKQIKELSKIKGTIRHVFADNDFGSSIVNTMEGLIDDVVKHTFNSGKDVRSIINRLGQLKKIFAVHGSTNTMLNNAIRRVGNNNGFTMIPKPYEWTFQKGGGQVQSIIDYLKDTPKVPKKTRQGWMQSIGEDPKRRGWNSRLWSALLAAEIVQSKREGNDTIYTLGPNAEPFEQGKLVGY